ITMMVFGGLAIVLMLLFWKEFKLLAFDRDFGASAGFAMHWIEVLFTTLLVIAIVIGLQAVGVVLINAMVVAPAAAARQWTNRLGVMVALAAGFGATAGVAGTLISSLGQGLSTGPVIVLCVSMIVVVSLLFAPNRGLVWNWLQQTRNRRRLQTEQVLSSLYLMAAQHDEPTHPHTLSALQLMGSAQSAVRRSLETLAARGLVRQVAGNQWALTNSGVAAAERMVGSGQQREWS
ncbi:MAG TPA: metal ABC transporter permease, partial [Caldilineaceae bacterium]|nr:metal ABC transporter permease [Caldilineaceae bacterium]